MKFGLGPGADLDSLSTPPQTSFARLHWSPSWKTSPDSFPPRISLRQHPVFFSANSLSTGGLPFSCTCSVICPVSSTLPPRRAITALPPWWNPLLPDSVAGFAQESAKRNPGFLKNHAADHGSRADGRSSRLLNMAPREKKARALEPRIPAETAALPKGADAFSSPSTHLFTASFPTPTHTRQTPHKSRPAPRSTRPKILPDMPKRGGILAFGGGSSPPAPP